MDSLETISELIANVQVFCEKRDWDQFHSPKDLLIGISTESNELLALTRFKSDDEIQSDLKGEKRSEYEDELADVLFFTLRFAQMNNIDISEALSRKIKKDKVHYPVESSRGKNKKYNEI